MTDNQKNNDTKPAYEQLLLDFFQACHTYNRKYDWQDESLEAKQNLAKIIKQYTSYKKSNSFRMIMHYAKDIKEIDMISNRKVCVMTKKNRSTVPACQFELVHKKSGWVIESFSKIIGANHFYNIFPHQGDYYLE